MFSFNAAVFASAAEYCAIYLRAVFNFIPLVDRKQNDFWNGNTFFLQYEKQRGDYLPGC